ncbi:RNA pseudouridine synthase [Oscillospiraceae bacterium N12]|jgi:tRNA pseudouridine32 synthase/23S rRNA pseudouridine746 synthase|uniref:RNA pseudouridine synthase n=1 Tax=Jilunia laotingensis TaxID=2763675 RepID=A0A926IIF1_9BACT|nr:RluA family pseudouridine synthase [Jilunia laotingensis]MBC8591687.1 RNA pseudouridine synthase [Jilunia laotingensis]
MLHHFVQPISGISLPQKFTFPFHYTPHPLCVIASKEVQTYLSAQKHWNEELQKGKMFGVLIVRTPNGELGYLAAFSGNLAGKNQHPYFVPPIYDLLQPNGFFKVEEENITSINIEIKNKQESSSYRNLKQHLEDTKRSSQEAITVAKEYLRKTKEERDIRRQHNPSEMEQAEMIRESQFQKAELKRMEREWKNRITNLQNELNSIESQITELKKERKVRSAILQKKLFQQFRLLNAQGDIKDLCTIFDEAIHKIPPAGAGECAAPKLLQYAYLHQLEPIAMAEFWWGESPKTEIRKHGYYYPACKGKCEPILKHMLKGLEIEGNPLQTDIHRDSELEIVYEDDWLLVVNKPAGMLSVPGKENVTSVYEWAKKKYPEITGPIIVHRLDMATSGLLLLAKTKETHQNLQAQFKNRVVKKRYVALLDGVISQKRGIINLPLCPNLLDRPRQMVNETYGKPAITEYEVLRYSEKRTRIQFYPLTGRTHQLRVHAAHPSGLDCPITGDELYGKSAERLYLHAEYLEFTHPVTISKIHIEKKADF